MKKFVLKFALVILCSNIFAQTRANYSSLSNAYGSIGTLDTNLNNDDGIEGSPFLFNNWTNAASIYVGNEKKVEINNINFNAQNSTFVSKISNDSIFTFYNIDKVIINYRTFIQINNKFYESLTSFNNGHLLKGYSVKVIPEKHKITNTVIGSGKYEVKTKYFLSKNGNLSEIKLRKKDILQEMNSKKSLISKYVKDYKLSYSKENDAIKIFEFFDRTN